MSPHKPHPQDAPTEGASNVIAFQPRRNFEPGEPPLTDAERIELRQMLQEFRLIKESCPMARRLTQKE